VRSEEIHLRIKTGAIVVVMSTIAPFFIGVLSYGILLEGYGLSSFLFDFGMWLFTFYAIFYYGNIEAHKGSIERDGDKYLQTLSKQLNDHGLTRLILKRWFTKYYDQIDENTNN
jgi:hypothetical protein